MTAAAVPARQAVRPAVSLPGVAGAVALVAVLAVLPPLVGASTVRAFTTYLIFGLLALSVGLITGYGRLFNIGAGASFGVSAYAVAILTQSQFGVTNPFVLFLCAMAAGFVVALLFAFYALIATGTEYLMLTFLTTLAFAVLPLAAPEFTGGDNGLQVRNALVASFGLDPLRGNGFYWFVLAVVAASTALSWFVINSQAGRAVQAIGRNPIRAAAMGYGVSGYRVALTLYSSMLASLAGWLYVLQNAFVHETLLGLVTSTNGLVYALIGGVDTILGPLLGAFILRWIEDQVSRLGTTQSSLYIGIVLMLVVYLMPEGLLGLWRRVRARWRGREAAAEAEGVATSELTEKHHDAL